MFDKEILSNGDLLFTADDEGKEELNTDSYHQEQEITEYFGDTIYLLNPEYIGALTDAPIFIEDLSIEDDGKITVYGKLWAFMNYQTENPWDILKDTGRVIFPLMMIFPEPKTFPEPRSPEANQMLKDNWKTCLDFSEFEKKN